MAIGSWLALVGALSAGQASATLEVAKDFAFHVPDLPVLWHPTDAEACAALPARLDAIEPQFQRSSALTAFMQCEVTIVSGHFNVGKVTVFGGSSRPHACPSHSTAVANGCQCDALYQEDAARAMCVPARPAKWMAGLGIKQPILPASAETYQSETDVEDNGPLPISFTRIYRSGWGTDAARPAGPLGKGWGHNHATLLALSPSANPGVASVVDAEGHVRTFAKDVNTGAWIASDSTDELTHNTGDGSWAYRRSDDDTTLNFNTDGKLQTQVQRNGQSIAYTYDGAGRLAAIQSNFGRMLTLTYNGAGQLVTVATQDQRSIQYSYDPMGRLSVVHRPETPPRTFLYDNPGFPYALTGIVDETGMRFASFSYDAQGRAVASELAGAVERYEVNYTSPTTATIIDPLGMARAYSYSATKGRLVVTSSSMPSGLGEPDAASRVQDADGLITSETDFKGVTTITNWDTVRRLPIRVEYAAGTPDARFVMTMWHPTFSLPMSVMEPGRHTDYTYDAVGNMLSRTVREGYTGKTWNWQWTYNDRQLVATANGPNGPGVEYYYDWRGNLMRSVGPMGFETVYMHDNANRVTSVTAPNGLVTTYTYDERDRLRERIVGGQQMTHFVYTPFGALEAVMSPMNQSFSYIYDTAHRLTGWTSTSGESGSYTLDGMGNRRNEEIRNSFGSTAWSAFRLIDPTNRLIVKSEGPDQTRHFGYDANGDLTRESNGLNQSTEWGLDSLRRVRSITQADNAFAFLRYDPMGMGAVTEAMDFRGVMTTYARDAQGNATSETSPDTGTTTTEYDPRGLPMRTVDALGQTTHTMYDPLGRLFSLYAAADGKSTMLRYDLSSESRGYLSEIVDRSGTTNYRRDNFGRVTQKRQMLMNGSQQQLDYEYSPNGALAAIVYPGGARLDYIYDMAGRVSALNWNNTPLVTDIRWNALGQPTSWTWAFAPFAMPAFRAYDTAGRLVATDFSHYLYDAAGRITRLTQHLYQPGDADPTSSSIGMAPRTWNVSYNAVGRITGFDADTGSTASFGYDPNGNRLYSMQFANGQTIHRAYQTGVMSNRITGFTQDINGASSTSVSYDYNANGDLLSDGLRRYTYDGERRLAAATTGASDISPTTRYAHNALGQRVFKTEPLYPPDHGDAADPGFMQSLVAFFTKLWDPSAGQAEQLGYAYVYDEQGTLLAESGSGGTNSAGQAQYIYLPTANGPMPIVTIINGNTYAVHSDHLNTPRKLTDANGQPVWQWAYSAFGDEEPTTAAKRFANSTTVPSTGTTPTADVAFNLRYPGQYADKETGLNYNYFRSYDARIGTYTQPNPKGLRGGWNRFGYVDANALSNVNPAGLRSTNFRGYAVPEGLPGEAPKDPSKEVFTAACSATARFDAGPVQADAEFGAARSDKNGALHTCL